MNNLKTILNYQIIIPSTPTDIIKLRVRKTKLQKLSPSNQLFEKLCWSHWIPHIKYPLLKNFHSSITNSEKTSAIIKLFLLHFSSLHKNITAKSCLCKKILNVVFQQKKSINRIPTNSKMEKFYDEHRKKLFPWKLTQNKTFFIKL